LLSLRSIDDTAAPTSRLLVHFPWAAKWHAPRRWCLATTLSGDCRRPISRPDSTAAACTAVR
jgi:hypothetical protein